MDQLDSNSTPLLANASYTSSIIDTLENLLIRSIIIRINTDVRGTLTIKASNNTNNFTIIDTINIPVGIERVSVMTTDMRYYRFVFTNGNRNQSVFDINICSDKLNRDTLFVSGAIESSAGDPIVVTSIASPISLLVNDNSLSRTNPMPISIQEQIGTILTTNYDKETSATSLVTSQGNHSVTQSIRLIGGNFDNDVLDSYVWQSMGTILVLSDAITIKAITTSDSASVTSVNVARLQTQNQFCCTIILNNKTAIGNVRRWGAFTSTHGYFFELNNGILRIITRKNSTDTIITTFNGRYGSSGPVLTSAQYEIRYCNKYQYFLINGILLHSTTLPNNFNLKIRFENFNNGAVSVDLTVISAVINSLSYIPARPCYYNFTTAETRILRRGPGTLRAVIINTGRATSTMTLYDNTAASGTIIAVINTATQLSFDYDLDFYIGLTVVTSGIYGNATVSWT